MKIICLHPNLLRRMLEPLGTTEIQRFQGAHGSAAAAAMAPLPGVTNRKLVHNLFSSEMSAGRGRLSPTLLAAPFRFIPALDAVFHHKTASTDSVWFRFRSRSCCMCFISYCRVGRNDETSLGTF